MTFSRDIEDFIEVSEYKQWRDNKCLKKHNHTIKLE